MARLTSNPGQADCRHYVYNEVSCRDFWRRQASRTVAGRHQSTAALFDAGGLWRLRRQSEKRFPRWRLAILIPAPMLMPSGRSLIRFVSGPSGSDVPSACKVPT
jgi:hypothetical protein